MSRDYFSFDNVSGNITWNSFSKLITEKILGSERSRCEVVKTFNEVVLFPVFRKLSTISQMQYHGSILKKHTNLQIIVI